MGTLDLTQGLLQDTLKPHRRAANRGSEELQEAAGGRADASRLVGGGNPELPSKVPGAVKIALPKKKSEARARLRRSAVQQTTPKSVQALAV